MKNLLSNSGAALLALVGVIVYLSAYVVDRTQHAIEIQLGDPHEVHLEPGLKFKLPFVSQVNYLDNRLLSYDADPGSVFTKDKKEMVVDTYAKWKISDPLRFYETVKTVSNAQARLDDIIYSQTREVLGQHTLTEIVSGNRRDIREQITAKSRDNAKAFGIEVADVRVKRADLPESNSIAVFGRMEAERKREAKRYRSEGEERALEIRSEADRDRIKIISEAKREAEILRGSADADATKIYADAYSKDPEFFAFLRSHDVYREAISQDTTLLFSSERDLFRFLK
ncbi:MAG: protease modulator HflC [bacterium]|jgi:membrane protease subunit HflC